MADQNVTVGPSCTFEGRVTKALRVIGTGAADFVSEAGAAGAERLIPKDGRLAECPPAMNDHGFSVHQHPETKAVERAFLPFASPSLADDPYDVEYSAPIASQLDGKDTVLLRVVVAKGAKNGPFRGRWATWCEATHCNVPCTDDAFARVLTWNGGAAVELDMHFVPDTRAELSGHFPGSSVGSSRVSEIRIDGWRGEVRCDGQSLPNQLQRLVLLSDGVDMNIASLAVEGKEIVVSSMHGRLSADSTRLWKQLQSEQKKIPPPPWEIGFGVLGALGLGGLLWWWLRRRREQRDEHGGRMTAETAQGVVVQSGDAIAAAAQGVVVKESVTVEEKQPEGDMRKDAGEARAVSRVEDPSELYKLPPELADELQEVVRRAYQELPAESRSSIILRRGLEQVDIGYSLGNDAINASFDLIDRYQKSYCSARFRGTPHIVLLVDNLHFYCSQKHSPNANNLQITLDRLKAHYARAAEKQLERTLSKAAADVRSLESL